MDSKKRKSKTLTYPTAPSSSRRRRRCRRRPLDHVALDEWRDWESLPGDVLGIVLSKLPQIDILRGAELACSPWRRQAKNEPLLWQHIDLLPPLWDKRPTSQWKAMARAAVERSAGRCESFSGHVDVDVLVYLANRAPLLRNFYVTRWPYIHDKKLITEIIKKLPLLECLVMSGGYFQIQLLNALLDHCPRLELLDVSQCRPMFRVWKEPISTRIQSCTIKDLWLPDIVLH